MNLVPTDGAECVECVGGGFKGVGRLWQVAQAAEDSRTKTLSTRTQTAAVQALCAFSSNFTEPDVREASTSVNFTQYTGH